MAFIAYIVRVLQFSIFALVVSLVASCDGFETEAESGSSNSSAVEIGEVQFEPADPAKALNWLTKAAKGGQPEAMFKLGTRYQYGLDVNKNLGTAKLWLKKAADAGWGEAKTALKGMADAQ